MRLFLLSQLSTTDIAASIARAGLTGWRESRDRPPPPLTGRPRPWLGHHPAAPLLSSHQFSPQSQVISPVSTVSSMEFQPPYFPPPSVQSAEVFGQHLQPDHYHHYAVSTLLIILSHSQYLTLTFSLTGQPPVQRVLSLLQDSRGVSRDSRRSDSQQQQQPPGEITAPVIPHISHLKPTLCLCSQSTGTRTFPSLSRESLGRIIPAVEGQSLPTRFSAPLQADCRCCPPHLSTK